MTASRMSSWAAWVEVLVLVVSGILLTLPKATLAQGSQGLNCSSTPECGWQARCDGGTCACDAGLALHSNGKDCHNASCSSPDCLQCSTQDSCVKCVNFIAKATGKCLQMCKGSAEMQGDNLVCTESSGDDDNDDETIIIAVVGGVAAGAVLCIIVIIIVCIYIRKTRRNINLQSKSYAGRHMDSGNVTKFSVYDNNAFEFDGSGLDYRLNKGIDPVEYQAELDRLRPHMDTLMALLSQTRAKTRAMKENDPRLPTYKGVIHQLCRVLVLLHKKDPIQSLPSDALSLVQWGHQMVEDSRQQETSDASTDFPTAQISSVDDLDYPNPMPISPVYATPDGSTDQGFVALLTAPPGQATPYSSVPVPLAQAQQGAVTEGANQHTLGRKSGFATISRTPSIPNGAILQNLEFSPPSEDATIEVDRDPAQSPSQSFNAHYSQYVQQDDLQQHPQEQQQQHQPEEVIRLRREEFRSFLINSKDATPPPHPATTARVSRVDDLEGETVITGGDGESVDIGSVGHDKSFEEENKFNTFGRSTKLNNIHRPDTSDNIVETPVKLRPRKKPPATLPRPKSTPNFQNMVVGHHFAPNSPILGISGSPVLGSSNRSLNQRPVSQTYSVPHKHPLAPTTKKNIITNPNTIKPSSFSSSAASGKKSKQQQQQQQQQSAPPVTKGYFANGRFYDPSPMPGDVVGGEGEVYAPGSNYSDRSNAMSTFLGDLPRSRSPSSSNHSQEGDDSENSGGDLDVFPFDPNDATDPVEV